VEEAVTIRGGEMKKHIENVIRKYLADKTNSSRTTKGWAFVRIDAVASAMAGAIEAEVNKRRDEQIIKSLHEAWGEARSNTMKAMLKAGRQARQ
jgi:hypothetical protein